MKRSSWATWVLVAIATIATTSRSARADARPRPRVEAPTPTDEQRRAQEHFRRARELYQAGKYSEAVADLELARGLDPHAKDLVINLGIVHEKLGKYAEAIEYLRAYLEMDGVTPAERAKVEGMIKRIEGAKRAAPPPPPPTVAPPAPTPPPPPSVATTTTKEPPPRLAPRGRVDALTLVAGSVAAAGLGLGAGLGIYAMTARPSDGFVTGRDGTYGSLRRATTDAHNAAVAADVCVGIGLAATVATAWLYFGRRKDAPDAEPLRVTVGPSGRAGAALTIGGTF